MLRDEAGRLSALRRYDVLDTAPEEPFDQLTDLVRSVLAVPIAAVSLVDSERQWFKPMAGLSMCETSREVAERRGRSRSARMPSSGANRWSVQTPRSMSGSPGTQAGSPPTRILVTRRCSAVLCTGLRARYGTVGASG